MKNITNLSSAKLAMRVVKVKGMDTTLIKITLTWKCLPTLSLGPPLKRKNMLPKILTFERS